MINDPSRQEQALAREQESSKRKLLAVVCVQLASALATALALAAGVILGQYVARPLKREAHRLETRLAGPRLVGSFRRHRGETA